MLRLNINTKILSVSLLKEDKSVVQVNVSPKNKPRSVSSHLRLSDSTCSSERCFYLKTHILQISFTFKKTFHTSRSIQHWQMWLWLWWGKCKFQCFGSSTYSSRDMIGMQWDRFNTTKHNCFPNVVLIEFKGLCNHKTQLEFRTQISRGTAHVSEAKPRTKDVSRSNWRLDG